MIYRHILSYLQLLVARFSGFSCNDVIRFGIVQPSYNTAIFLQPVLRANVLVIIVNSAAIFVGLTAY